MLSGTVIADSDQRLFVVLASNGTGIAIVPLRANRRRRDKRYAGDVAVTLCGAPAVAHCGRAQISARAFSNTGFVLTPTELAACQRAAERASREAASVRQISSATFAACQVRYQSGGRRVGPARAA